MRTRGAGSSRPFGMSGDGLVDEHELGGTVTVCVEVHCSGAL